MTDIQPDYTPFLNLVRPDTHDDIRTTVNKLRDALDAVDAWAAAQGGSAPGIVHLDASSDLSGLGAGTYRVDPADGYIVCDAVDGQITVYLPDSPAGTRVTLAKTDIALNTYVNIYLGDGVNPAAMTILGALAGSPASGGFTLGNYGQAVTMVSDGTMWFPESIGFPFDGQNYAGYGLYGATPLLYDMDNQQVGAQPYPFGASSQPGVILQSQSSQGVQALPTGVWTHARFDDLNFNGVYLGTPPTIQGDDFFFGAKPGGAYNDYHWVADTPRYLGIQGGGIYSVTIQIQLAESGIGAKVASPGLYVQQANNPDIAPGEEDPANPGLLIFNGIVIGGANLQPVVFHTAGHDVDLNSAFMAVSRQF